MKRLLNPISLLFTVTIPGVLLFALFGSIFLNVRTQLSQDDLAGWTTFGMMFLLIVLGFTLYAAYLRNKKKSIKYPLGFVMFICYALFVSIYVLRLGSVTSGRVLRIIPRYMFIGIKPPILLLSLVMPAIFHSAVLIASGIIERFKVKSIKKTVIVMMLMPLCWYIVLQAEYRLFYLRDGYNSYYYSGRLSSLITLGFTISVVISSCLAFIVMCMFIGRYKGKLMKYRILVVSVTSLAGLILNSLLNNLFGDFSHPGFLIADIFVIILLLFPEVQDAKLRLLLFGLRICGLWYSIYFFVVFLPYIPLAFVGAILLGLGYLLLAPAFLLYIHLKQLKEDYTFLAGHFQKQVIWACSALAFLVVPVYTGAFLYQDKVNLNKALDYVYQRNYDQEEETEVNVSGIERVLNEEQTTIAYFTGENIPYLSSLYRYVVLDGLRLSDESVKVLETMYLGKYHGNSEQKQSRNISREKISSDVIIEDVTTDTVFDQKEKVYKSWIHLELKNLGGNLTEFYTAFDLPQGSYISNYYLYMGGYQKYGLLADKRAANWIYERVKNQSRDPGVLTDLGGRTIEFKVFPFQEGEIRKTGIEIIHNRPIKLVIENRDISLGLNDGNTGSMVSLDIHPQIYYVTKETKENLQKTVREPEYYFIVDVSKGNEKNIKNYTERINTYIEEKGIKESVKEVIGVNYKATRLSYEDNWEEKINSLTVEGGFCPEFVFYQILYENYMNPTDKKPVFIFVTYNINHALFVKNMADLNFIIPEGISYYHLTDEQELIRYVDEMAVSVSEGDNDLSIPEIPVLAWKAENGKTYYLPDDDEDTLILPEGDIQIDNLEAIDAPTWRNGVLLEALYRSSLLKPKDYREKSYDLVKSSIRAHLMMPLTSFIVLETREQETQMLKEQKKLLESEVFADGKYMTEMEEPSLYIIGFIILGYVYRKKKKLGKCKNKKLANPFTE